MSYRLKVTIFILLLLAHVLALIFLGVSFITTSLLFYACCYLALRWIISKSHFNSAFKSSAVGKLKVLISTLVVIEIILFLVPWVQTPTEKQYGLYVSTYKYPTIERLSNKYLKKDFRIMYEHGYVPNSKGVYQSKLSFNEQTIYNSLGYRGEVYPKIKAANEKRICMLGDSFVEGHGVADSLTMPIQLKTILNNNNSDSTVYTVMNGGLRGADPVSEFKLYKEKLAQFDPDVIILVINISDLNDIRERGSADDRYKNGRIHYTQPGLSEYFSAIIRIYRLMHFVKAKLMTQQYDAEIEVIANACEEFSEQLPSATKFYVCYLPIKREVNDEQQIMDDLEAQFASSDLTFFNLNDAYMKEGVYDPKNYFNYFWRTDSHHTPKGYRFMAEVIARELMLTN